MAYPITGSHAKITAGAGNTDLAQLFGNGLRDTTATINPEGSALDATPFNAAGIAMMEHVTGLRSGTVDFTGLYPKTAPVVGISGLVSGGPGYVTRPVRWSLEIDFGEEEITSQTGEAGTFRRFMPGGVGNWRGEYVCLAIDSTTVGLPTTTNAAGTSATFKLCDGGAADPAFTGAIAIIGHSHQITVRGRQEVTFRYQGSGALSQVIGTDPYKGLLYTTTRDVERPFWDDGTAGNQDLTVQYFTGRTYSGRAFWRSLRIESAPGELVRVSGSLRFDGDITAA